MKTKIKRHSRSVLSVVLALCMLISCMTVGLIATDAAKTTEQRVGAASDAENVGAVSDSDGVGTAVADTKIKGVLADDGYYIYVGEHKNWNQTNYYVSSANNTNKDNVVASGSYSTYGVTQDDIRLAALYVPKGDYYYGHINYVLGPYAASAGALYVVDGENSTAAPAIGATKTTVKNGSDYLFYKAGSTSATTTLSTNSVNAGTNIAVSTASYDTSSSAKQTNSLKYYISDDGENFEEVTLSSGNLSTAGLDGNYTLYTVLYDGKIYVVGDKDTFTVIATTALTPTPTIEFDEDDVTASSASSVSLTVTNHSSITTGGQTVSYDLFKSETSGGTYTKMDATALTNAGITYSNGVFTIPAKYSNAGYYKVQAVPTNNLDTKHESALSAYAQLTVNRTDLAQPTISLDKAAANKIGDTLDPVVVTVTNYAALKDYCTFSVSGATGGDINADGQITLTNATAAYDGHANSVTVTAALNGGLSEYYTINGSPTSSASAAKTLTVYKPAYSLLGNVNSEYLVGSQATTNGWNDTGVGYQSAVAINTVTETPGKYSITVRTQDKQTLNDKSHTTINLGVVNESGQQYGFVKGTSSDVEYWYNNVGSDYVVPAAGVASSDNFYVHIMDASAPGGSFVIQPNTTYTIFVDQTKKFDDSNKLGQIYIDVNTYHVNTRTMVQTLNPNTGDYNAIAAAPSYVGTATASPTSGSAAAAFNSTLTATTDATLYNFEGWFNEKTCIDSTDLASKDNPYTASITSGSTYYALFKEKEITYTLSAAADNPEGYEGTVAAGTYYPGSGDVYKGATVTFTATPAAGTKVEGWYVNGKLQNGALGNTFTLSNINENTVVTAKFKVKITEPVTVRVNDSDLGSAAVTKITTGGVEADPPTPVVAAENATVQVTLTARNEGAPSSITVTDDVTGAAITPTEVSNDNDTAVYTFTMPENSVTVTANFTTYSGTSSYYFDGRNSDKSKKSDYFDVQMSEAKYNGQKYAYYRLNYDTSSTTHYFTVKTTAGSDLSADGYVYFKAQHSESNSAWLGDMKIQYYVGSSWTSLEDMTFVGGSNNEKWKSWKHSPPAGFTKIKFVPNSNTSWYKEVSSISDGTSCAYQLTKNGLGLSSWDADSASDIYVYSSSTSSPTSPTGMYLYTDNVYYSKTGDLAAGTDLAAANISGTARNNVLPTVSSLSTPYYVLVFYPNTDYGKLTANDASNFTTSTTPKIIVSKVLPGGTPPVTPVNVYAKDGTLRDGYQVQSEAATTTITKIVAPDGTTIFQNSAADSTTGQTAHGNVSSGTTISSSSGTITIGADSGVTYKPQKEGSGSPGSWYEKITQIPKGSTVTVRTVLADDKDMFAKGSPAAGKSFRDTHYVRGYSCNGITYELHDYDASGVYTEDIKIPASVSIENFEITPVYYMKDTSNCKTFIITGFDKTVQSTGWGNTLAVYPYYYNTDRSKCAFGGYPGTPLLCYGGTYMIQIPITNDGTDSGKEIRGLTLSNNYWDTVHRSVDSGELNDHRQTYDYDDFVKIYKEKNPDNIYLSYKYRNTKDNFSNGAHYSQNKGGSSATYSDYAGSSGNGVEDLVDALGRKIDIFGNVLTSADITAAGNNKILIVSDGYCDTYVGDYATEWNIYKSTDGGTTYTKQSKAISPSALIMNSEASWSNKYTGYNDTSAGKLGYYKGIYTALKTAAKGIPAEITYEKDIRNGDKDQAYRLDARWLYSFNSDKISANVKIEYQPLNATSYVEDPFTNTNEGTTTHTKAYFTNYTPKDVYGQVTATDFVIDPENNFTLMAEEASGYEFVGWYVQYEGHDGETPVSKEGSLSGESPIIANATYVARFRAVQSGSLNVSHVVEKTEDYKGDGTPYMLYVIKDGSGNIVETNGAFKESSTTTFKNSSYIKTKYSDYTIDVYLATVPNSGCTFGEFDDSGVPANFKLDKDNTSLPTIGGAAVTAPSGAYGKYAKASFTVAQVLADTTNNGSYKYVSHIELDETYTYSYDITYSFTSRKWGTQKYNVNGTFTEGQVKSYVTGTATDARLNKLFLTQQKPYESNFLQKIDWDYDNADQSCSDVGTSADHNYKIVANVTSIQDPNLVVRAEFNLPYDTTNGVANATGNGKVAYDENAESVNLSSEFLSLFQTDNSVYHFDDTGVSIKYANDYVTPSESGKTYREHSIDIYNSLKDTDPDTAAKYNPETNNDWLTIFWTYQIAPKLKLMNAPDAVYRLQSQYDTFEASYSYTKKAADFESAITDARVSEITGGAIASASLLDETSKTALEETFLSHDKHNDYYNAYKKFYETDNSFYTVQLNLVDRTYTVTLNGNNYDYVMDDYVDNYTIKGVAAGADMNKFDELKFYRWKIESTSKSTSTAKDVSYCYDEEFNFTGFENYTITPEYYTAAELAEVKEENPDVAASITFIENSRNQWNVANGARNTSGNTNEMVKADKVFADFNLAFNYNGVVINKDSNINVGVLIQQVQLLDDLSTGKPVTDPRYYTDKITVSDAEKTELQNLAKTTTKSSSAPGHITINSRLDNSVLSSKNRVEYYYTFNNKNVVYSNNIREFSDTTDRNYVYRAYSYIYNSTTGDVYLSDQPAYFTLYDIATK